MKRFEIFKEDNIIVDYQLFIDNKIIKSTSEETLQKLIKTWLNKIQINGRVEVYTSDSISITTDKYHTNIFKGSEGYTISLYRVESQPKYDIREV